MKLTSTVTQILYWVVFWLLIIDGGLIFMGLIGGTTGIPALLQLVLLQLVPIHLIYGTIGAAVCTSPLFTRTNRNLSLLLIPLWWAVYWTFILTIYVLRPTPCYNPLGKSACEDIKLFGLILLAPISLLFCWVAGFMGNLLYQRLLDSRKTH
jgi:hypothetical protein